MPDDPNSEYARRPSDSNVPVPDPTRLTTQLVDRALAAFREVMETRLAGMDRATELLASELQTIVKDRDTELLHQRDDSDRAMAALREFILSQVKNVADVSREKFEAITTQFAERDTRAEQAAQESRISLDAALAAAKEAVSEQNKANALAIGKSEDATKERLDALALLMTTSVRSLEDKIADVKSRLDRGEAGGEGRREAKTERRLDVGQVLVAVSIVIAAIGLAVALRP